MTLPPWMFNDVQLIEAPEDMVGFIYHIQFSNGMMYIGKKNFIHTRKLPPLKGKKRKRKKVVDSGWQHYVGSIKDKDFVKGYEDGSITALHRTIISVHKKGLDYQEVKAQFEYNVLEKDNYYNTNIAGRYYRSHL